MRFLRPIGTFGIVVVFTIYPDEARSADHFRIACDPPAIQKVLRFPGSN